MFPWLYFKHSAAMQTVKPDEVDSAPAGMQAAWITTHYQHVKKQFKDTQ